MGLETTVLDGSIAIDDRVNILNGLWHDIVYKVQADNVARWDPFFAHYMLQCKQAVEYRSGEYTFVRKHQDVLAVARGLEDGLAKQELERKLLSSDTQNRHLHVKTRMAEGSIRLAVRLAAMLDVGPPTQSRFQNHCVLLWNDQNQNLKSIVAERFKAGNSMPKASRFDQHFNAFNLRRYANLKIQWTNNLADHLRLIEFDSILCIFHHTTFLQGQNSAIFPDGFLQETQLTLALLFPRYDKDTRKWIEHERREAEDRLCLDMGILDCDTFLPEMRHIDQFQYWRDELVALKDLFEQPRSTSIKQFWHDDRNKVQWYTFWVAILVLCLTIFFGLVQSIEGAMQVYKAYHPTPG